MWLIHSLIHSVSQSVRSIQFISWHAEGEFVHVILCRWTSRIQHCHGTLEWSCGWMQATTWQLAASWEQAVVNESVETVIFNDLGLWFNQVVSSDMMWFTQFASFCTTRVCVVWYFYIMFLGENFYYGHHIVTMVTWLQEQTIQQQLWGMQIPDPSCMRL